jgi:hypothetical protein
LYFIFRQVEGPALKVLEGQLQLVPQPPVDTIIKYLVDYFTDPVERQHASDTYRLLVQGSRPFNSFYETFRSLATTAQIPEGNLREDLYWKVNNTLKRTTVFERRINTTLEQDRASYAHYEQNEATIHTTTSAQHKSSRKDNTHTSSKGFFKQRDSAATSDKNGAPKQDIPTPNIPKYHSAHPSQQHRSDTPYKDTDRSHSFQGRNAINAIDQQSGNESSSKSSEYKSTQEDPEMDLAAAEHEAIAHTKQEELSRAKDSP